MSVANYKVPKIMKTRTSGGSLIKGEDIMYTINMIPPHRVKKPKRFRSAFTTDQVNYLEKQYKKCPYIININRKNLANSLNISEKAIKIWFQNRRMKEKKETTNKELDDESTNLNAVELTNVPSNYVCAPSANDEHQRSLPVITDTTCENGITSYYTCKILPRHIVIGKESSQQKRTPPKKAQIAPYSVKPRSTTPMSRDNTSVAFDFYRKYKSEAEKEVKLKEDFIPRSTQNLKQDNISYRFVQNPVITSSHKIDAVPNHYQPNIALQSMGSCFVAPNIQLITKPENIQPYGTCVKSNKRFDSVQLMTQDNNLIAMNRGLNCIEKNTSRNNFNRNSFGEEKTLSNFNKSDNIINDQRQAEKINNYRQDTNTKKVKQEIACNSIDRNGKDITRLNAASNIEKHPKIPTVLPKEHITINNNRDVNNSKHFPQNVHSKLTEQILPEDLSSTKVTSNLSKDTKPYKTVANNSGYNTPIPTNIPFYAQTYMPASGVIWKPINLIRPVLPTPSISTIASSHHGNIPVIKNNTKSCNCNCHGKHCEPIFQLQTNPQYIFTAVPYHNSSA